MPELVLCTPPVSVRDCLGHGAAILGTAGCESPRLDAELLLAAALGVTRARLVLDAREALDEKAQARFQALLLRRAAREPVAYIVGYKEFRQISLAVDRRVLIPRPETELLVEVGLSLGQRSRVVDVGTGSGAVALALKQERPDLLVSGIDSSADAVILARANALRLDLEVSFLQADLLDEREYDAVLANLPYVAEGSHLAPEIALYEPSSALYGGDDGLDLVRRLISRLDRIALVALEVGFDQAAKVSQLLERVGFSAIEPVRDLAGHERVIIARR